MLPHVHDIGMFVFGIRSVKSIHIKEFEVTVSRFSALFKIKITSILFTTNDEK